MSLSLANALSSFTTSSEEPGHGSGSGSGSDSPSDLGAATGKPSSAAKGGAGTSQPLSKRARRGGGGVPTSPENKGGPAAGPSKLPEEEPEEEYWASVPSALKFYGIELDEEVLRVGTRMVGRSKVEEVKKRFREFQMEELKMAAERAALAGDRAALKFEVTKLFVDGYLAATK